MNNKVLLIEDNESLSKIIKLLLEKENINVIWSKNLSEAFYNINTDDFDVIITDLRLPDGDGYEIFKKIQEIDSEIPVIIITAYGNVADAVNAVKNGIYDYISKPFDNDEFVITVRRAISYSNIKKENKNLKTIKEESIKTKIIGESKPIKNMIEKLNLVAPTDAPVLILGESGVGKELVAKYIYSKSLRKDKAFITVNCSAIPENLFESEFFGHKKGAFTGADADKKGKLEEADGGTIFLDEIGDIPLTIQPKLLRFLQEGEIEKVGDSKTKKLSVRIIAATNRDLKKMTEEGSFRADLFYRLNIFPIHVPPLRERKSDLQELIQFFCKKYRKQLIFEENTFTYLFNYDWPGNVREIENLIYRLTIICKDGIVKKQHLPPEIYPEKEAKNCILDTLPEDGLDLEELEKNIIEMTLKRFNGNKAKAAKYLKLPRHKLIYRLERYGIK
ncbi:MAG: sigma-54 dependent transcriptional regulator [Calditerrivibrio sp.]|nr:sigma-54 dependent transcriptional regulator [Calditerrivibrio sp.]